jgi:hypothetical protein
MSNVPPDVRAVLEPLARWFVAIVKEVASEQPAPLEHYTAKNAPMPPCTFRKCCRTGVFPRASCAGGEWRAPKDEVDAWLAKQPKPRATAKPRAANAEPTTERSGDELLAAMEREERGQTITRKGKRS